jgi:hypothetical protein
MTVYSRSVRCGILLEPFFSLGVRPLLQLEVLSKVRPPKVAKASLTDSSVHRFPPRTALYQNEGNGSHDRNEVQR